MTSEGLRKDRKLGHEQRLLLMFLLGSLPGVVVALVLLWSQTYAAKLQWTLTLLILGFCLCFAFALRRRVAFPLRTLSNLLSALREGDFSLRIRGAKPDDALGEVIWEANALGETLREQRLSALEATALLGTVMAEIDVAIFAFDDKGCLRLVNRLGEQILAQPAERLIGRAAQKLSLSDCLKGENVRTFHKAFPGKAGRWDMRRSSFRERGLPHYLVVLSDLSRPLREEERQAWRRLIRVLSHELNNSLAPIKSVSGSLENLLMRNPRPQDWEEDMQRGLRVIAGRSESLSQFMEAYARLARLPKPQYKPLDVSTWILRVVELETRLPVALVPGPKITIQADGDQLEQLLINLLKNAVDAALETAGRVSMGWEKNGNHLRVWIEDEGPGIPDTANLFVPFFTTKPGGSGIGLVLSRQIAEAHGGNLTLENRQRGHGCKAHLCLPF